MTFRLDHVIIAVRDLDAAMTDFRALGFTVLYGGRHASGTTHNALICFQDGSYLELLALTGDPLQDASAADFSALAQGREGLAGYAMLVDDLKAAAASLQEHGVPVGPVTPGRRVSADGREMRWLTAAIGGGMSPFLIEDETPRSLRVPDTPPATQHPNGVIGLVELDVLAADLDAEVTGYYAKLLGVAPWRNTPESAIFIVHGIKLRLVPAVTPAARVYLAQGKTPLYRLALLGNAPNQFDPVMTHGVLMEIAAKTV